jgi:hypothetical protein
MRTVSVRYLVPVYATVDLDAEPNPDGSYDDDAVVRVFEGVESITRIDILTANPNLFAGDPLETSYDEGSVDPASLTKAERERALTIAGNGAWPMWES